MLYPPSRITTALSPSPLAPAKCQSASTLSYTGIGYHGPSPVTSPMIGSRRMHTVSSSARVIAEREAQAAAAATAEQEAAEAAAAALAAEARAAEELLRRPKTAAVRAAEATQRAEEDAALAATCAPLLASSPERTALFRAHRPEAEAASAALSQPRFDLLTGFATAHDGEALFEAACHARLGAVRALLRGGADVAWRTAFGDSALHCAACEGQLEMARLLLAAGADINARNVNKQTPLGWAVQYKKPEVAALLVSFGGEK